MASMTRCGTCVPPGPSRNAAGCPLTVCASDGNWEQTQGMSKAEGGVSGGGMSVDGLRERWKLGAGPGDVESGGGGFGGRHVSSFLSWGICVGESRIGWRSLVVETEIP